MARVMPQEPAKRLLHFIARQAGVGDRVAERGHAVSRSKARQYALFSLGSRQRHFPASIRRCRAGPEGVVELRVVADCADESPLACVGIPLSSGRKLLTTRHSVYGDWRDGKV